MKGAVGPLLIGRKALAGPQLGITPEPLSPLRKRGWKRPGQNSCSLCIREQRSWVSLLRQRVGFWSSGLDFALAPVGDQQVQEFELHR